MPKTTVAASGSARASQTNRTTPRVVTVGPNPKDIKVSAAQVLRNPPVFPKLK